MTDVALAYTAYAEANHGRWVADCPRPYCTNAMQLERGQTEFLCGGAGSCGILTPIQWPADPDAIEALLLMRPAVATRNWKSGEPLRQLLEENVTHGIVPSAWLELAAAQPDGDLDILETVNERVVGGVIFHQLEAAGLRREIGA